MIKIENTQKTCFLTSKGWRTPKYIWQGEDKNGELLKQMTRKELESAINRNNRLF